jgi:hypothetical protein
MPVLFKNAVELRYIMLCDCTDCKHYWDELSAWQPQFTKEEGKLQNATAYHYCTLMMACVWFGLQNGRHTIKHADMLPLCLNC